MQVSVNTEEVPYRASHAILLYGQHRPGYASVHDVEVDSSGELSIEAGVPATVDGLRKMFDSLDPSARMVDEASNTTCLVRKQRNPGRYSRGSASRLGVCCHKPRMASFCC